MNRLDWQGEAHGGPFTSAQTFDLRDAIPERSTLLVYLSVRRLDAPGATGKVTAAVLVKSQQGVIEQLRATVSLGDEGTPAETALGVFHKMARDVQSSESELQLVILPEEDAAGLWSVDVSIV